jgi:hypothetical protein
MKKTQWIPNKSVSDDFYPMEAEPSCASSLPLFSWPRTRPLGATSGAHPGVFDVFFWKKKGLESGLGVCQKGNLKGFLKIILGKLKKMVDLQGLWTICFGQHGGFIIFSDYVLKEMYQPTRGFKWT